MIFSYNWLKEYFKNLPAPEELSELLTMHSFEIEEMKKSGDDYIFDISVLPNRAGDCWSVSGMAKEIAGLLGKKIKEQPVNIKEDRKIKTRDFLKIESKNKNDCRRYSARMVFGVKVGNSPDWMKKKLEVSGLRSINNIVDSVNYAMLESGQPMHVFDFEKLSEAGKKTQKMIVKRAEKGEGITVLDGARYNLNENVLLICDNIGPLAIAGIKGGKRAEVDEETNTIVIESANFNPTLIRKASQSIGLRTDASMRFEHGIDPDLTEKSINRAAELIQQTAGGRISFGILDFYPLKSNKRKIALDVKKINSILGSDFSLEKMIAILENLGFKAEKKSKISAEILIPSLRRDIIMPEDLAEEIGRVFGYYKIKSESPYASIGLPVKNSSLLWEECAKNLLVNQGFSEIYNYSFVSAKDADNLGWKRQSLIEIENPTTEEHKYMRPSLIVNLLKNIANNFPFFESGLIFSREKEMRIFEIGKVFSIINESSQISERKMIAGALISSDPKVFYKAKGALEFLFSGLGAGGILFADFPKSDNSKFIDPENSSEIRLGDSAIGFLGKIQKEIADNLKINASAFLFEIDFDKILSICKNNVKYEAISPYPPAIRDLAVLVYSKEKSSAILEKIIFSAGPLLKKAEIFDMYEGSPIPIGKKSLAFHITYQSKERTLGAEEIDQSQKKIIEALESIQGWEVRK
jgi:phenylalanyl-tRNA synthetase beta chain